MKLSILIPAFNEEVTIKELLLKVRAVSLPLEKEIIVVDDASTDSTAKILSQMQAEDNFFILSRHLKNQGKGAAIKTGLQKATGDFVLIQDADLEYEPNDYPELLAPLMQGRVKVVYGSRNLSRNSMGNKMSSFWFYFGGRFLTLFFNLLFGIKLTDINTCYKVFKREIFQKINLKENNFNFCEEVTAKTVKAGYKILEVPIHYYPRKKQEGKKINWKDGLRGLWAIVKYRFRN